ncbi:MAG: tetratricopeptide repeat protein [Armatimonadetes bacterium]|nr:tetratricopeptide repeat protein [Armatimonadota bacterium]
MADVAELLVTARRALARGDHHKALPLLRQAAKLEPDLFGTQMLLGVCLSACGQPEEGLAALRRAVRLNPDSPSGQYNLAAALRDAGQRQEAAKHFETALRIDPNYTAAATALRALGADSEQKIDGPSTAKAGASTKNRSRGASSTSTPPATRSPDQRQSSPSMTRARRQARAGKSGDGLRIGRWLALAAAGVLVVIGAVGVPRPEVRPDHLVWIQQGDFTAVRFTPDGAALLGVGSGITVWEASNGSQVSASRRGSEDIADFDISADGSLMVCSAWGDGVGTSVTLRRVDDGVVLAELPATAGRKPVVLSPDGTRLAVGTDYMGTAHPLGVQVWSVPAGQFVRALGQPAADDGIGYIAALAFSDDGSLLASADDAGVIRIYQTWDGSRVKTVSTQEMCLTALTFTPSGGLAYGGTSGPRVTLCALPQGDEVASFVGDDRATGRLGLPPAVTDLDISPDGRLLALAESTRDLARIEIFDLEARILLATIDALVGLPTRGSNGASADVRSVRFSPDGRYLAWCGASGVAVASVQDLLAERD